MFRVITIMFRVITIMFRVITIMFRVITIKFICDYGAVYCARILEQCSRIQRNILGIKPPKDPEALAKELSDPVPSQPEGSVAKDP